MGLMRWEMKTAGIPAMHGGRERAPKSITDPSTLYLKNPRRLEELRRRYIEQNRDAAGPTWRGVSEAFQLQLNNPLPPIRRERAAMIKSLAFVLD